MIFSPGEWKVLSDFESWFGAFRTGLASPRSSNVLLRVYCVESPAWLTMYLAAAYSSPAYLSVKCGFNSGLLKLVVFPREPLSCPVCLGGDVACMDTVRSCHCVSTVLNGLSSESLRMQFPFLCSVCSSRERETGSTELIWTWYLLNLCLVVSSQACLCTPPTYFTHFFALFGMPSRYRVLNQEWSTNGQDSSTFKLNRDVRGFTVSSRRFSQPRKKRVSDFRGLKISVRAVVS